MKEQVILSKEQVKVMEEQLKRPFPAECIEWMPRKPKMGKEGYTMQVIPYISKTSIQDRLDEVFGIDGWTNKFEEWKNIKTVDKNGTLLETQAQLCTISVKFGDIWISKQDGAGDSDIEGN